MADQKANEIVAKALQADQLDELLLGRSPYAYLPRWSPSDENTDLTILLNILYKNDFGVSKEVICSRLVTAARRITGSYEGLFPVATLILFEAGHRARNDVTVGLPLNDLAADLGSAISKYRSRLIADKSGPGSQWEDGRLGDLRRLSDNSRDVGGPGFA